MTTVILVVHIMIAAALVALVLVQRSEGGALGIGGGGGGFMSGRGAANLLTRITAVLAAGFFGTSLLLAVLASSNTGPRSILTPAGQNRTVPAPSGDGSSLPKLAPLIPPTTAPSTPSTPQVPQGQ
jgi:preprotein translocase subunit SecG